MTEPSRDLLRCAGTLLDQGRVVDRLSRALTAATLILLLVYSGAVGRPSWAQVAVATLIALAGLGQVYFAMRVGFDAALFQQLAGGCEEPDFAGTDAALTRLGLLPATKVGRPIEARVAGARRLLRLQAMGLAAQVACVLLGACLAGV
jgi:hypothetical protein